MQLNRMEEELIQINNIRNLESVKIWDVMLDASHKVLVVPALDVFYDGHRHLSLTAKDKNFNTFVKKVNQVYQDEKNQVHEDSMLDPFHLYPTMDIDAKTKRILESGTLEQKNEIYRFYEHKSGYEGSLFFQSEEVALLMPIVRYHIERFYQVTDQVITFDDTLMGYRDQYILNAKRNGTDIFVPILFNKLDEGTYTFEIGNTNPDGKPLTMQINFKYDRIEVKTSLTGQDLESKATYFITKDTIKSVYETFRKGLPIAYENKDLIKGTPPMNLVHLDEECVLHWFQLPWGAYYGVKTDAMDISDTEKIIEIQNMYLLSLTDQFSRMEYYARTYRRNSAPGIDAAEMILDEVKKTITGTIIDPQEHLYKVETLFSGDELTGNGYYDGKLKNHYFYHVVQSPEGILGITREKLINVGPKETILQGSDLLNKAKIMRLVKGE